MRSITNARHGPLGQRPANQSCSPPTSAAVLLWLPVPQVGGQRKVGVARKRNTPLHKFNARAANTKYTAALGRRIGSEVSSRFAFRMVGFRQRIKHRSIITSEAENESNTRMPMGLCHARHGKATVHNRMKTQLPNPSIEGTCNIRLRLLSPAPHVKR
jgi:hypothetical protein